MSSAILARIARQLGDGAIDALLRLAPRDLTSLLLHLLAARAERLTPSALVAAAGGAFFAVSPNDARKNHAVRGALFDAARGFTAVEIAPVLPLGATRLLGAIHPNNVLGAVRGAELVGDTSAALVLEAVRRRRAGARATPTRLCGAHRCFRLPYPPTLLPHFGLFAAVTALRADPAAEADELRAHLAIYLAALRELTAQGHAFPGLTVSISDTFAIERRLAAAGVDRDAARVRTGVFGDPDAILARLGVAPRRGSLAEVGDPRLAPLAERVVEPLAEQFPEAEVRFDLGRLEGLGYYSGPCVRVTARDVSGRPLPLVDGGYLRWTRLLLGDRRERLLSTGMGIDLVPLRFATGTASRADSAASPDVVTDATEDNL